MRNRDYASQGYVNRGEEDEMEIFGFKRCSIRTAFTWVLILLTGGILRLLFHWFPRLQLHATNSSCPISSANKVLLVDTYQQDLRRYYVKEIKIRSVQHLRYYNSDSKKIQIYLRNGRKMETESFRYFYCKKICYVWDEQSQMFVKLSGLESALKNSDFYQHTGLTDKEQELRQIAYGPNELDITVDSLMTLLMLEVLNPFYIFQVFSLIVWYFDEYYYFAITVIVMLISGAVSSILQTRRSQKQLKKKIISPETAMIIRLRDEQQKSTKIEEVMASTLVPGDVIAIPPQGCVLPCDAVLLTGNVIVNECLLTGESVPVTKIPIHNDDRKFNEMDDTTKHSILFSGTKVLQTRFHGKEWAKAVVLRTGFMTTKGQIIQTILYPPPVDFRFERDSYKFLAILALVSIIGLIYAVITKYFRGIDSKELALRGLVLFTIVIPPALPAAMTIGKIYAQKRLQDIGILCINSRIINIAGSVDCICFDKTGTLTEEGLDLWGVIPTKNKKFEEPVTNFPVLHHSNDQTRHITDSEKFIIAMATCHSLTYIDGEMAGDPLDQKMFESTGWQLNEPEMANPTTFGTFVPMVVRQNHEDNPIEVGIARQFYFSSSLQRMSVIVHAVGTNNFEIYCKGSPETLITLSKPETVPAEITSVLESYTRRGFRVLGLATKPLPPTVDGDQIEDFEREEVESDLTFLGLILFENKLKKVTESVVHSLRKANIKMVMVTGDNILTAISVAEECGLVAYKQKIYRLEASPSEVSVLPHYGIADYLKSSQPVPQVTKSPFNWSCICRVPSDHDEHLETGIPDLPPTYALTGQTWAVIKKYHPNLIQKIVKEGTIFARMTPDQKQQLVQELQSVGYCVVMCGDGANDCAALKAAHAGVSLSDAESSAASAFTANCGDISCVPKVIIEGRCALVTSFGIFKFMAGYSLTQFASVMILYTIDSYLTDFQFLYIDLCLVTLVAALFGLTKPPDPSKGLAPIPPSSSLFSIFPITSIILQVSTMLGFQLIGFFGIQHFLWYKPFFFGKDFTNFPSLYACYENYAVFAISSFQYLWMAVAFSRGAPHRCCIWRNLRLVFAIAILVLVNGFLILLPPDDVAKFFELALPPSVEDRTLVLILEIGNLLLCLFLERFLMELVLEPRDLYLRREKSIKDHEGHGCLTIK